MKSANLRIVVMLVLFAILFTGHYSRAAQPSCPGNVTELVALKLGEILLIESAEGKSLLWFTKYGPPEEESTYRWRFQRKEQAEESSGTGKVFEKYIKTKTGQDKYELKNVVSQLLVRVGAITVEWSYGAEDAAGWIYFDAEKLKVTVIKGIDPNNYKF